MKHLVIRHFGPIEEVNIELKRINVIIGPQSSGKSTVLKVACFCDWLERQIELTQNPKMFCQEQVLHDNLIVFAVWVSATHTRPPCVAGFLV
jgi:predicted ATPase